jgi:simple sugar transport system ATP-binding protein
LAELDDYFNSIGNNLDFMLSGDGLNISGGQKQRIALARALYLDKEILILDEPTSALGVYQTSNVLKTIEKVREKGVAVVFISHNVSHALAVGDKFTVLSRGETLGTALSGEINFEELQSMMSGHKELSELKNKK